MLVTATLLQSYGSLCDDCMSSVHVLALVVYAASKSHFANCQWSASKMIISIFKKANVLSYSEAEGINSHQFNHLRQRCECSLETRTGALPGETVQGLR